MDANNLLYEEIEYVDSRVTYIEADVNEIKNLLKLLSQGVKEDEDSSVKTIVDMSIEKLESILVNDIVELNDGLTKIENKSRSLSPKQSKPKKAVSRSKKTTGIRNTKAADPVDVIEDTEVVEEAV